MPTDFNKNHLPFKLPLWIDLVNNLYVVCPTSPIPAFNRVEILKDEWGVEKITSTLVLLQSPCWTAQPAPTFYTHCPHFVSSSQPYPAPSKHFPNPVPKCPCLQRIYCHLLYAKHLCMLSHRFSHLSLKTDKIWGTGVVQLVEGPTLDVSSGHNPRVMASSPESSSVLSMQPS